MKIDKEKLFFMLFILFTYCVMYLQIEHIVIYWILALLMLFLMIIAYIRKKKWI